MKKEELLECIIIAKHSKGLTWEGIANALGVGKVWITSVCFGMNSMDDALASQLCDLLELPDSAKATLTSCPLKTWDKIIPQDPLIYRFYEVMGVYGDTLKAVIHEEFGDGIMSAIDFTLDVQREACPKGDRVKVIMNGKFLPYKSW